MEIQISTYKIVWMAISIGIITIVVLSTALILHKLQEPDCYIALEDNCMFGYDSVGFHSHYWYALNIEGRYPYKQCCKRPHYVIQGIDPTVYYMNKVCEELDNMNNTQYSIFQT